MAKRRLPPFNSARGAANLTSAPPFTFHGVTCRMFPLKANMFQLRTFCDNYLNVMPPEIAWYEPSLPYVFLIILDYGKMGPDVGNFGWVSQNEVAFGVALDWYKKVDGKLVFQDWGFVCPFIFVDEESSLVTGREVYGWPKVKGWFDAGVNPWAAHPRNPRRLLTVKAQVVPKIVSGSTQKPHTLLEIYQDPPPSASIFPPSFANPLNPWIGLPTLIQGAASLADGIAGTITRPRLAGYDTPQYGVDDLVIRIGRLLEQFRRATSSAWLGGDEKGLVTVNCLNLKQFRAAPAPGTACYQAVTNSKMEVFRFNRAGLLGDVELLQGDLSGGYFIDIHNYDEQPIIDSLGIEVTAEGEQTGPRDHLPMVTAGPIGNTRIEEREDIPRIGSEPAMARVAVSRIRPTLPLWVEVDLRYTRGQTVASRTARSHWTAGSAVEDVDSRGIFAEDGGDDRQEATSSADAKEEAPGPLPFNTARGAATQSARGPFEFEDMSRRVFPLLADKMKLQAFVDGYLNFAADEDAENRYPGGCFEVWGRYVYMVVTNYGAMSSSANAAGWFAERDVSFVVPLKWYDKPGGDLLSVTSVIPFCYANSGKATTTGREVLGVPSAKALLSSPPDSWMSEAGLFKNAERQLLSCRMNLIPSLDSGLMAEERTLFEIVMGEAVPYGDQDKMRHVATVWGDTLVEDHYSKVRRATEDEDAVRDFQHFQSLVLDPMVRGVPMSTVTLKQFRDAESPQDACYQALLYGTSTIREVSQVEEMEERVHVLIHAYPTQPIVDALGLVHKVTDSEKSPFPGRAAEGVKVCYLQPIRPFWARMTLELELSEVLCWRSGSTRWRDRKLVDPADQGWRDTLYLAGGSPRPRMDGKALRKIESDIRTIRPPDAPPESMWRRDLKIHVQNWQQGNKAEDDAKADDWRARTRKAIEVFDPQMAFERLLSEGWESAEAIEKRRPNPFLVRGDSASLRSGPYLFQLPRAKRQAHEGYHWEVEDNWAYYMKGNAGQPPFGDGRPGGAPQQPAAHGGPMDRETALELRALDNAQAGKDLEDSQVPYPRRPLRPAPPKPSLPDPGPQGGQAPASDTGPKKPTTDDGV